MTDEHIVYPKDDAYKLMAQYWAKEGFPTRMSFQGNTWLAIKDNGEVKFVMEGNQDVYNREMSTQSSLRGLID